MGLFRHGPARPGHLLRHVLMGMARTSRAMTPKARRRSVSINLRSALESDLIASGAVAAIIKIALASFASAMPALSPLTGYSFSASNAATRALVAGVNWSNAIAAT